MSAVLALALGGAAVAEEPAPDAAALDAAMREHRVFRHVLVGALAYPPHRITWVLARGAESVRLQAFCQVGKPTSQLGVRLTGQEGDASIWGAPALTTYIGRRTGTKPGAYALAAAGPVGDGACETMPSALHLGCRVEKVSVLRAGAVLVPGKKGNDDRIAPSRWQPSSRDRISALRCDVTAEGTWPFRRVRPEWPLMFASPREDAAGIEWAHEDSDMVVQAGGYRWLPVAP